MAKYVQFTGLVKKSSSAIGKMIGLGKKFIETGISELDSYILPKLRSMLSTYGSIVPRVLPSYAVLMWFTLEVNNWTCIPYLI